jgi:hypothetical protein
MPGGVADAPPTPVAPAAPDAIRALAPAAAPGATTATVQASDAPPQETPAPPEAAESAPEPPPVRLTLTLASGGGVQTLRLDGPEAAAMLEYLHSRSGALIRAR